MCAMVEGDASAALFQASSRQTKVLSSTDKTIAGQLRPRLVRDVEDLKVLIHDFPFLPRKREGCGYGGISDEANCGGSASTPAAGSRDPHDALYGTSTLSSLPADFAMDATLSARTPGTAARYASDNSGPPPPPPPPPQSQPFLWIDMKKPTLSERNEVLSWFPLHPLTLSALSRREAGEEDDDRLGYFPSQGYLFLSLTGTPPDSIGEYPAIVVFVLFEHVLLTITNDSYIGEENVALAAVEAINGTESAGISSIFSALVSSVVLRTQDSVAGLMVNVDQLDELVLQIQPSEMDQNDMLVRIREMRHRVAWFHTSLLLKERVLKQLLLPTLRGTTATREPGCIERYQRSLTLTRGSIEKLRRGRDTVNLSCMNLVSGVCARLLQHCHRMDYLNHVQSQIALVVMPVALLPGLWSANVQVPWQESDNTTVFWAITAITLTLLLMGLVHPVKKYFTYKPPGALVPSHD